MKRKQNPNLEILELAIKRLGALSDEMVFLGGCATGLLITDPAASPIRVTRDVDAIVQVASLAEYHKLAAKLRAIGFKEDVSEGAPLCRWVADEVILDVMPTKESVLGFGNRWYANAIEHALMIKLPSGQTQRSAAKWYPIERSFFMAREPVSRLQPAEHLNQKASIGSRSRAHCIGSMKVKHWMNVEDGWSRKRSDGHSLGLPKVL